MVNTKKKGNRFELETAKLLTETTGAEWQRVPQSGAFATKNNSNDPRFNGDIFTEHPDFQHIVIECKSYKKFELNELFSHKSDFYQWINQCCEESKGEAWVMFIKAKSKGVYAVSTLVDNFITLNVDNGIPLEIASNWKMIKIETFKKTKDKVLKKQQTIQKM